MGLLTTILGSPASGLMFVLAQIRHEIDREMYDETLWQQKLLDLQLRYDLGEIDDATFTTQESAVLAQLDLIAALRDPDQYDEWETEYDEDEEYDNLISN